MRYDRSECLQGRITVDRDGGPWTGRERQVAADDRRAPVGQDLLEADRLAPAVAQDDMATGARTLRTAPDPRLIVRLLTNAQQCRTDRSVCERPRGVPTSAATRAKA